MKNLRHLLAKDLRRFWPQLVLSAGTLATVLYCTLNFYNSPYMAGIAWRSMLVELLPPAYFILIFVISVVVVQEDQVVGGRAAWLTRPIQPETMLASKLVFLFLGLAVPAAILTAVAAAYLGSEAGTMSSTATTTAEIVFVVFLFAALAGAITKTLSHASVVLFGTFLCLVAFSIWLASVRLINRVRVWPWPSPFHNSPATSNFITAAVAVLAAIGALGYLYRSRRPIRAVGAFFLFLWMGNVLGEYWPIDFLRSTPEVSAAPLKTAGISVKLGSYEPGNPANETPAVSLIKAETQDGGLVRIAIPIRVEGSPLDEFVAVNTNWSIKMALADGRDIPGSSAGIAGNSDFLPAKESALGLSPSAPHSQQFEVGLNVPARMFAAVKGQNARADAEIQITPFVYRIIHQFPLTAGVRFRTQGEVWQILEMEDIDHSYCELTVAYVGIPRRPRFGVPTRTQDFALALVNSERNEVSISVPTNAGFWGSDSLLGGLATGNFHQQFRDRRPRAGGPSIRGIDADWLRHAELYVLAASEGTTVILPFADSRITIPAAAEPASHGMAIGVEVAVP